MFISSIISALLAYFLLVHMYGLEEEDCQLHKPAVAAPLPGAWLVDVHRHPGKSSLPQTSAALEHYMAAQCPFYANPLCELLAGVAAQRGWHVIVFMHNIAATLGYYRWYVSCYVNAFFSVVYG